MTSLTVHHSYWCVEQVFGWDTVNNDYDMDETDGRSYISAVSEIVIDPTELCEGNAKNTMGEARMVRCGMPTSPSLLVTATSVLPYSRSVTMFVGREKHVLPKVPRPHVAGVPRCMRSFCDVDITPFPLRAVPPGHREV